MKASEDAERDQQAGDRGGDDRQLDRPLPAHHPGPQQDAEDDQGYRVEGVMEGEEGDHAAADVASRHARFAQSPVGQGDAAGAAGAEDQRRRDPRHVDLVGLAPGQPQGIAADHGFEQRDVGDERGEAEADRDRDPDRVGFVEAAERVAEADQLREEEIDPDQQGDDDDQRLDQPFRREEGQPGGAIQLRGVLRLNRFVDDRVLLGHPNDATRSRSSPDAAGGD